MKKKQKREKQNKWTIKKKNLPMDLMNYLDSIDILFHFVEKKTKSKLIN